MILLRVIVVAMTMFVSNTVIVAQDLETKVTQRFTINGDGWNKVLKYGDPVTIFAYKEKSGIHSFGIYAEDYAGTIDLKIIPFDVQPKQLKKLPKNSKKKLTSYTDLTQEGQSLL